MELSNQSPVKFGINVQVIFAILLSHNFGHGEVFLSNTLTTLNILAFLLHRAQEFWDAGYCTAHSLMPRIAFFDILRVLTSFAVFPSFDRLIEFLLEDDPDLRKLILDTS